MPSIPTWMGHSKFTYSGCPKTGTRIMYGASGRFEITAHQYAELRSHFLGRSVPVRTSRTSPASGSLGAWLKQRITKTAIASYVASILVQEGHAKRVGNRNIKMF